MFWSVNDRKIEEFSFSVTPIILVLIFLFIVFMVIFLCIPDEISDKRRERKKKRREKILRNLDLEKEIGVASCNKLKVKKVDRWETDSCSDYDVVNDLGNYDRYEEKHRKRINRNKRIRNSNSRDIWGKRYGETYC